MVDAGLITRETAEALEADATLRLVAGRSEPIPNPRPGKQRRLCNERCAILDRVVETLRERDIIDW